MPIESLIKERGFSDDNEEREEILMSREYTKKIINLIETNYLTTDTILWELLQFLSEEEVKRFFQYSYIFNDWKEDDENER